MCSSSTRRDGDSQSLQEGAVKDGFQVLAASPSLSHAWFPCGALEPLSRAARARLAVLGTAMWGLCRRRAEANPRGRSAASFAAQDLMP